MLMGLHQGSVNLDHRFAPLSRRAVSLHPGNSYDHPFLGDFPVHFLILAIFD